MVAETVSLRSFKPRRDLARASFVTKALWHFAGLPFFSQRWLPGSEWRASLLRAFGAKVGVGVHIKGGVTVRCPWLLEIGNHSWVGEGCWIDNWVAVSVGNDACLSQGCYLCTGNHDWSDPGFAMRAERIEVSDGAWVAARVVLAPGVIVGRNAIAGIGSVVTASIPDNAIHFGNPATFRGVRKLRTSASMPPLEDFEGAVALTT